MSNKQFYQSHECDGFRARVTIEWSIPERVDETTIRHRIQDAEDIAEQILGFAAHRVRNMVQAMRGITSEVQGLAPSVWNDEYQAKALKLAAEVIDRRHANYAPSYQEKLLLADALMHAVVSAAGMPPASHESERESVQPRVTDNDAGEITVALDGRELRGWSYKDDAERRTKMLAAREYVEGWCDGRGM